jgi:hypothetical protein
LAQASSKSVSAQEIQVIWLFGCYELGTETSAVEDKPGILQQRSNYFPKTMLYQRVAVFI